MTFVSLAESSKSSQRMRIQFAIPLGRSRLPSLAEKETNHSLGMLQSQI
jgi:hypothetical protein